MSVSEQVKALLAMRGMKQIDLINILGKDSNNGKMSSRQSLNNKFAGNRWSAKDLINVAAVCGCKLAFILPDGERIILTNSAADSAPATPGGNEVKQG